MADKVKKAHGHIIQADWNQTDPLQMDYIHNKPEIDTGEYKETTIPNYKNRSEAAAASYNGVLVSSEPIQPAHVATKNYVDTTILDNIGNNGWHEFSALYDLIGWDMGWQGFFMGISYNTVFEWIGDIAWVWDTTTGPNTGEFFTATVNQGSFRMDGSGNWNLVGITQDENLSTTAKKYVKNGVIKMSGTADQLSKFVGGGMIDVNTGIAKYTKTNYTQILA